MIYLDSGVVIYSTELDGDVGDGVRQCLAEASDQQFCISPLVIMECLVKPLREHDYRLHDHYQRLFDQLERLPLAEDVFVRAAQLRADSGVGMQDAIHVAAAQRHECGELWTTDARLAKHYPGFARNVLV
jgi:predicted nucleic acid-binding protein